MLVFRIRTRAWLKTSGAVYMENLPFRCGTDWVKGQKPEDWSKDTTSVALCWLFCFALFNKYNSVANTKTKGCWLTGGTICCAACCFLNVLFCCKQWSEVIRVQCDMGNVHLLLKTVTKFGVSIRNNKRTRYVRTTSVRPSLPLSGIQYQQLSLLLAFYEIWFRYYLQKACDRAWFWRLRTLGRAFCCNDRHRETPPTFRKEGTPTQNDEVRH